MDIIKSSKYKKDLKTLKKKHLINEELKLNNIETLIFNSENFKDFLNNNFSKIYKIEKKKGDLKNIYTARLNNKIRLYIKPCGKYPYELVEIVSVLFEEIDFKHYKEG